MQSKNAELTSSIWIIILAAGFSKRMGKQKLLLNIGEDTLIRHVIKNALQASVDGIVVVTNPDYPEVKKEIEDLPVIILENEKANSGMSSSLGKGIRFLKQQNAAAAIILLADQPDIYPSIIDRLCQRFKEGHGTIIQASYNGIPSHPVLFSQSFYEEILKITGDQGARNILRSRKGAVDWLNIDKQVPKDIDTPADYQSYTALIEKQYKIKKSN